MKIAVMGAGAVGSYYGGLLARAGHDLTLIGRASHVDAVNRAGLDLDTQTFRERVPVRASTQPEAAQAAKLVLFCVKSTDTERAGVAIASNLAPDAVILNLQNGVDNAERLRPVVARAVIPAVVYVAVAMVEEGHVRHFGRGELVIGASEASAELAQLFRSAGIPVEISADIESALWTKLILNCAHNALSAITQLPYGRLAQDAGAEAIMRDVVEECLAVARAAKVSIPADVWDQVVRIAKTMPEQRSSTAQDLARGRRSEIDHLNGFIVRKGEALGVATPVNRALQALVRLLEARGPA